MRFSFLAVLTFLLGNAFSARAEIIWEHSYDAAKTISRASGKPLFINFYTDWCGVCKKVDRETFPDARVQQLSKKFVMLRLDAEREGAPQARAWGVRAYPTLVFLSPQGQRIYQDAGGPSAEGFTQLMQRVLQSVPAPRANAPIAPQTPPRRAPVAAGSAKSRQQAALRRASASNNDAGVFLLDENGVVALDKPVKKAGSKTKVVKKTRKSRGY